jgi:hypothetical protein
MHDWERVSDWCIRSPCGEYTIAKIGLVEGWRYELWHGKNQIVVGMLSASEAIRAYTSRLATLGSSSPASGAKSSQSPAGAQAEQLSFIDAS